MMRLFMIQMIFSGANKAKKLTKMNKIMIVILVSLGFILKDLQSFFAEINPNIY